MEQDVVLFIFDGSIDSNNLDKFCCLTSFYTTRSVQKKIEKLSKFYVILHMQSVYYLWFVKLDTEGRRGVACLVVELSK